MTVVVSPFVKRQTRESQFSHYDGSWEDLAALVETHFSNAVQGYREGVLIVSVPPDKFCSGIVQLQESDVLVGEFKRRTPDEEPRKEICVCFSERFLAMGIVKQPAQLVQIILYSHAVLAENKEQSCDADFEIISINASPQLEEVPMPVDTLIANHFRFSGGTQTNMTDSEFVEALRKSAIFWKDKALLSPRPGG